MLGAGPSTVLRTGFGGVQGVGGGKDQRQAAGIQDGAAVAVQDRLPAFFVISMMPARDPDPRPHPLSPPHGTARSGTGVRATLNYLNPIDEDMMDAGGILDRCLVGRRIGYGRRVEEDEVCHAAGL